MRRAAWNLWVSKLYMRYYSPFPHTLYTVQCELLIWGKILCVYVRKEQVFRFIMSVACMPFRLSEDFFSSLFISLYREFNIVIENDNEEHLFLFIRNAFTQSLFVYTFKWEMEILKSNSQSKRNIVWRGSALVTSPCLNLRWCW